MFVIFYILFLYCRLKDLGELLRFNMTAPTVSCGLEFSLMDFDRGVSSADLVYFPQAFSLDRLIELAYEQWSGGRELLGAVAGQVIFDTWPSTTGVEMTQCL